MTTSTRFTRRGLFKIGLGGVAAAMLPREAARAQEGPAAGASAGAMQGAGFYRFKVGQIEVALVSDGGFPLHTDWLFVQNTTVEQVHAALADALLPPDQPVPGHVNALLIRTGADVLLIDTGCGSVYGPSTGRLPEHLGRLGVTPAEVTAVVLTHFHPDHIGGLIHDRAGMFPNARFVTAPAERAFWSDPNPDLSKSAIPQEMRVTTPRMARSALEGLGAKLELVEPEKDVVPGVRLVAAPGHTPGHTAVHIASGGAELLHLTDAVHLPAVQFTNPDWHVAADVDPVLAVKTRKALFDRAAADRLLVTGAHIPFPGVGRLRSRGSGYEWVPAIWEWEM